MKTHTAWMCRLIQDFAVHASHIAVIGSAMTCSNTVGLYCIVLYSFTGLGHKNTSKA